MALSAKPRLYAVVTKFEEKRKGAKVGLFRAPNGRLTAHHAELLRQYRAIFPS